MNLYDIVSPLTIEEAKTDYQKKRERERAIDAGKPVPKQREPRMTDYQKRRAEQKRQEALGENSWSGPVNAWSSEHNNWTAEDAQIGPDSTSPVGGNVQEQRLSVGDPVIVTAPNEFEGKTGEIDEFSPSGAFVIVNLYNHGKHSMHLSDVEYNQYADEEDDVDEGWSNKMVAQRTGQAPTPYSVYIKGREWKSFADDDHAENVANKLRAKFKDEGRDASVITIAPTDYDKTSEAANPAQQAAIAIAKKKQVSEFALGNGGDDNNDVDPRLVKMAHDAGVVKGYSLADAATLTRAMAIDEWDTYNNGIYKQYFADGFKKGRLEKIRHGNEQYNLNLKLMKDGSVRHGEQGVAEVKQRLDSKCWAGKHKEGTKIKGGVRVNNCVPNESVEEALSQKDLVKQVGDMLNDPEFRKKPADPTKSFTRGDHWKGAGPDDYGYTGYQGHGMPTDKAERARIRADKKKGVAEMDKSQKGAAGWNIDDYPLGAKGTTVKPTTVKNVVKSATKDLDAAFNQANKKKPKPVKESYWTRLQNERSTRLNSLVDELKASIK
jgi:hypothetical protein